MFTKRQMLLLGLVISQGILLNAMNKADKATSSPIKSLSQSQEILKHSQEILKSSSELRRKKNSVRKQGEYHTAADLVLAERYKNDPRIWWLPI